MPYRTFLSYSEALSYAAEPAKGKRFIIYTEPAFENTRHPAVKFVSENADFADATPAVRATIDAMPDPESQTICDVLIVMEPVGVVIAQHDPEGENILHYVAVRTAQE